MPEAIAERPDISWPAKGLHAIIGDLERRGRKISVQILAEKAGMTKPTVRLALSNLLDAGLAAVVDLGPGKGRSYRVTTTGQGSLPVKDLYRSRIFTGSEAATGQESLPGTGQGSLPVPVKDLYPPNDTELYIQQPNNNSSRAAGASVRTAQPEEPKPLAKRKGAVKDDEPGTVPPHELPAAIDTPEVRSAWASWTKYRRERRKPLTESTIERQLAQLAKHAPAVAVAMIERSITNGWTGLFPIEDGGNGYAGRSRQSAADWNRQQARREFPESCRAPVVSIAGSR